jgi:hydroxyethylthiazole kinase
LTILSNILSSFERSKKLNPLVLCITNSVTVNDCVNAILACNASPIVSENIKDAKQIITKAQSLVINIGDMNKEKIKIAKTLPFIAQQRGTPVILDPVGCGFTKERTLITQKILKRSSITAIRCNMGEISSLMSHENFQIRGVDSLESTQGKSILLAGWAKKLNTILAVTGEQDIVTDGKQTLIIHNGHRELKKISGTGCMATAITGAFLSDLTNQFWDVATAVLILSLSGELAFKNLKPTQGTSSLKTNLIDKLGTLNCDDIKNNAKIEYEVY